MNNSILKLSKDEVKNFFLESGQYHNFELPEYFNFDTLLSHVFESIADIEYEDCLTNIHPENIDYVNIDILLNKDGHYAVRPLTLANPFLYCFIVKEIYKEWESIQECFNRYKVPFISACAIPVVASKPEAFHKASTIMNWWNSMEQRSIELSLKYRYMFTTDITNCYGCITPQSIDWAFSFKNTSYECHNNKKLSDNIRKYLCALQKGHNIGIPQGSILFDFISELVLGYSDLLLYESLQKDNITDYEIIRYRDDYKIFCNDKGVLEKISYKLQYVLESLNFRMNSQKTKLSDSIITDSIKSDKLAYIFNTPVLRKLNLFDTNGKKTKVDIWDFSGIQKHLLYILMFARQYPNSGQVRTMLSDLDKKIEKTINKIIKSNPKNSIGGFTKNNKSFSTIFDNLKIYGKEEDDSPIQENISVLTAICVQIALENITLAHYALRTASRIISTIMDESRRQDLIKSIYNKLSGIPNSDYSQLWLQNITLKQDKVNNHHEYTMPLCRFVMGESFDILWNNIWIKQEFLKDIPSESIIVDETIEHNTGIITFRETRAYMESNYNKSSSESVIAQF